MRGAPSVSFCRCKERSNEAIRTPGPARTHTVVARSVATKSRHVGTPPGHALRVRIASSRCVGTLNEPVVSHVIPSPAGRGIPWLCPMQRQTMRFLVVPVRGGRPRNDSEMDLQGIRGQFGSLLYMGSGPDLSTLATTDEPVPQSENRVWISHSLGETNVCVCHNLPPCGQA